MAGFYLNKLASEPHESQQKDLLFYIGTIITLKACFSLLFVVRWLVLFEGTKRVTLRMHNRLIDRVIRAPINLFFDVTPIGKLLNRFSSDLKELQWGIMHNAFDFIMQFNSLVVTFSVAFYVMD